jgi:hypothetical protein
MDLETAQEMMEEFVKEIESADVEALLSQDLAKITLNVLLDTAQGEDPVTSVFGPHKKLKHLMDKTARFSPLLTPLGDALETCPYRIGSGGHNKLRDSKEYKVKHSSLT